MKTMLGAAALFGLAACESLPSVVAPATTMTATTAAPRHSLLWSCHTKRGGYVEITSRYGSIPTSYTVRLAIKNGQRRAILTTTDYGKALGRAKLEVGIRGGPVTNKCSDW